MRDSDICFLNEIWEKKDNSSYQNIIEEILEMRNIQYISNPRPGSRRGGGVAIAYRSENCSVSKLNIKIPPPWRLYGLWLDPTNHLVR